MVLQFISIFAVIFFICTLVFYFSYVTAFRFAQFFEIYIAILVIIVPAIILILALLILPFTDYTASGYFDGAWGFYQHLLFFFFQVMIPGIIALLLLYRVELFKEGEEPIIIKKR